MQTHIKRHEERNTGKLEEQNLKFESPSGASATLNGPQESNDNAFEASSKPPTSNKVKEDPATNDTKLPSLIPEKDTTKPLPAVPKVHKGGNTGAPRGKYNIKPKKVYRCSACPFKTKAKEKFDHHVETVCTSQIPTCQFCQAEFPSKDLMKHHIDTTHKAHIHSCDQCPFITKHYYHLLG